MKAARTTTALYAALVFASGAVVGGLGYKFLSANTVAANVRPSPDEWRKKYMAEMQSRLNLSADQTLRVNILLDETRSRVREVHARAEPEIGNIKKEQIEKIRGLLDDKQKAEYDTLRKEREDRAKKQKAAAGDGL